MNISHNDFKSFAELMVELAKFKGEIESLRTENKCLREDRDSWKQMAMRAVAPEKTEISGNGGKIEIVGLAESEGG